MTDPEVGLEQLEDASGPEGGDPKSRRSRVALVVVLLLLLLLCVCSTTIEVWVDRSPDQVRFVARNLECLQCHTELIPEFSYPSVHDPFLKKECTVCHTRHGKKVEFTITAGGYKTWERFKTVAQWLPLRIVFWTYDGVAAVTGRSKGGAVVKKGGSQVKGDKSVLTAPETELCWTCHGDLGPQLSMTYGHNPFAKGYCTTCHRPHASKNRALLVTDERDLCVTCHPIGPELARAQVHPPAGQRYCTNCHHPHASNYRGILVTNQRELCFICHPSVAALSLKSVQHNPFLYDNCTGCHEPHGSDFTPLLRKESPALCYDCHAAIARDFEKPSHHPVGTVKLDCESCHNPHAADYPKLLTARDNSFCYRCHGSAIQASFDKSAHRNKLCIDCHTPHGSYDAPLLQERNPWLCYRCHPSTRNASERYPGNHPHLPQYYDAYARKPMTCTSTCHDPHGSGFLHMVGVPYAWPPYGRDNLCLKCHTTVGIDF